MIYIYMYVYSYFSITIFSHPKICLRYLAHFGIFDCEPLLDGLVSGALLRGLPIPARGQLTRIHCLDVAAFLGE